MLRTARPLPEVVQAGLQSPRAAASLECARARARPAHLHANPSLEAAGPSRLLLPQVLCGCLPVSARWVMAAPYAWGLGAGPGVAPI